MTPLVSLYIKIGKMTLKKRDNLHGILQWISKFIMIWHGIPGVKYKHRCNSDESLEGPSYDYLNIPVPQIYSRSVVLKAK